MRAPLLVGVSLKAYLSHERGLAWCGAADAVARAHPAVRDGRVGVFAIPGHLQLAQAASVFAGGPVRLGAQDVSDAEPGPYTGEVTAAELAELGVRIAELGHAERRARHGETDEIVAAKAVAAHRHGLVPLVCVGERGEAGEAIRVVAEQTLAVVTRLPADAEVLVAYEPVWAIGAEHPAPAPHVVAVVEGLRRAVAGRRVRILYGGSAGPGVLGALHPAVDGVFLGRSAHDPEGLRATLDEAAQLR